MSQALFRFEYLKEFFSNPSKPITKSQTLPNRDGTSQLHMKSRFIATPMDICSSFLTFAKNVLNNEISVFEH